MYQMLLHVAAGTLRREATAAVNITYTASVAAVDTSTPSASQGSIRVTGTTPPRKAQATLPQAPSPAASNKLEPAVLRGRLLPGGPISYMHESGKPSQPLAARWNDAPAPSEMVDGSRSTATESRAPELRAQPDSQQPGQRTSGWSFSPKLTSHLTESRLHHERLGLLDALGIALLVAVLLFLSFLQSRHRIFWSDEIMGDYVLHSGSWQGFLDRWRGGLDSSGFWFYFLAQPWEWIFGRSELSLRMFSAAGVSTAAALTWTAARRFYSLPIVAVSTALIFLETTTLRWQLSNGRSYGLMLAATALVILLVVLGETRTRPSQLFLLGTVAAYGLLVGTHILGILYAGSLLAIQLALDLRSRPLRPALYGSALFGIALMGALSLANIRGTLAVGKPSFWTTRPMLRDLLLRTDFTRGPVRTILVVLFVLALLRFRYRSERASVYYVMAGFLGIDLFAFAISRVGTSIYIDRYLLPITLALVFLSAELLTQIKDAQAPFPRLRAVLPLVAVVVFGFLQRPKPKDFPLPGPDYTGALIAKLPPGLPVVFDDMATFVEMEYYHHGQPYLYPLTASFTDISSNPAAVPGFNEIRNFSRLGINAPDLQPTDLILSRYPDMLIITEGALNTWFTHNIIDSNRYVVLDRGEIPGAPGGPRHLWEVHRKPA